MAEQRFRPKSFPLRRRDLIAMVGGAAVGLSRRAWADEPGLPVVGFLNPTSEALWLAQVVAFRRGLEEGGYVEGRNVRIEYRWGEGHTDRLPQMAADLVSQRVSVIAATGEIASAKAAQAATSTIPTVFTIGADPVKLGLVASWNKPGGNITGIVVLASQLVGKEVEILSEIFPATAVLGVLTNPENEGAAAERDGVEAARQLGRKLVVVQSRTEAEIESGFEKLGQEHAAAVAVVGDPLFLARRGDILRLAARYHLSLLWPAKDAARIGALVGYGNSVPDAYREAGAYVGRILQGTRPADLPVKEAAKVELSINLKAAKALGLTIPPMLLARADEVIE